MDTIIHTLKHRPGRTAPVLLALVLTACAGLLALAAPPAANADNAASISVINGEDTTIEQHPWQVALLDSQHYVDLISTDPGSGPLYERQFCGGALIAPTMVVTAAHCVTAGKYSVLKRPENISVLAGRTELNDQGTGGEVEVDKILMPEDGQGRFAYLSNYGWDVALVKLKTPAPSPAQPIKLIGPDEKDLMKPGSPLTVTGWGQVKYDRWGKGPDDYPMILQQGPTNVQPGGLCDRVSMIGWENSTDLCSGQISRRVGSCYGDSGGPLVAAKATEPRLVSITSRGAGWDGCNPTDPTIDTAMGKSSMRDWIRDTVQTETGVNPVGSGATQPALPKLVRAPAVLKRTKTGALRVLRKAGFTNIKVVRRVKLIPRVHRPRTPRVIDGMDPGWLVKPGTRYVLTVQVQMRTPRNK